MSLLLPSQITPGAHIGGKARALLELSGADVPIPAWAALPGDADVPEVLLPLDTIGPGPYAIRSSAVEEDSATQSFAGQFDSFLFVPADKVAEKIMAVRASARSARVDAYRIDRETAEATTPGVVVQQMVDPAISGVAFSADPVTGERRVTVISAVWGVGSGLVSGECDADTWRLDRDGRVVEKTIARKKTYHKPDPDAPEGTRVRNVPEGYQNKPALNESQLQRVHELVWKCARHFECPQDIEWAIDESGILWLLQSRPITTLSRLPDPGDPPIIWDNSNIAESYSGVTTPLTFTFARRAYEHVYREFCRILRVSEARIEEADDVYRHMLGLVRGRVYYNLVSWYRVLALLPGFQVNRSFMEQMMGVKEPLPEEIVDRIVEENQRSRLRDRWDLVRMTGGLIRSHLGLPRSIRKFYRRLGEALEPPAVAWGELTAVELVAHYRELETRLLRRWDAPLVNDFLAMIFYGVLRNLCRKWAGDEEGTLQNELLLDSGDIISAEPPRRIREMAALAGKDPALVKVLTSAGQSTGRKLRALRKNKELSELFETYLADFGDRCLEELKLESPTVVDDPSALLSAIGNFAIRSGHASEAETPSAGETRADALSRIRNPLKALVFSWVLKIARARVRDRENLRFERTRLFGRVRRIVRELGERLAAEGQLRRPEDVFYLNLEEVLSPHDATLTSTDLQALVATRKREFQAYQDSPAPPDRFQTRGPLHRYREFESDLPEVDLGGDSRQGVGACAGIVRGPVRVVDDPREANLGPHEILVAQQTDPGWVILFPSAAGLLVERGSLLSHSAIVSREMNLPCIVSLPHITQWLKTGDWVEMDGKTGVVRKVDGEE